MYLKMTVSDMVEIKVDKTASTGQIMSYKVPDSGSFFFLHHYEGGI